MIIKLFNAFYSTYYISKWDYKTRMTQHYGYCDRESWGFYEEVSKKFDLKNEEIRIINNGGYVIIDPLFKDINNSKNINSKYLMLLNFQSEINKDIYSSKIENIDKYSVKYRLGNCYLLKLND
jgi:virulence-associated protein VagC